jgi:magnesium-transporting ATPase (P-type)
MRQPFKGEMPKSAKKKKANRKAINKALLLRLKILGFILIAFAFLFFSYALKNPPVEEPIYSFSKAEALGAGFPDLVDFEEDSAENILNFYAISGVFLTLSAACFLTSWRQSKKNSLK